MEPIGIYLDPIKVNFIIRPAVSLIVGLVFTIFLLVLLYVAVPEAELGFGLTVLMWLVFSTFIGMSENEMTVPTAHAAMLTFFGMRFRVYLTEGNYSWWGQKLFIGRSNKVNLPGTDDTGFIYLGDIPIQIWNSANEKDQTVMSNVARDKSTVYTTLTIVLKLFDPYLWVNSNDPLTDVAERARGAFRTAVSFFVGTDVASIKSILSQLMSGKTIVTAFLHKTVGTNISRSMLQNSSGAHQYTLVSDNETLEDAKRRFGQTLTSHEAEFDSDTLKVIQDRNGHNIIEDRSVNDALDEVARSVGAEYCRASIGDVSLSQIVEDKANAAASEVFQRDAQVASAEAIKAARRKLMPTAKQLENPGFQDAAMIAAAQDNPNIKISHVTGGSGLAKAFVAGANQLKDKSDG